MLPFAVTLSMWLSHASEFVIFIQRYLLESTISGIWPCSWYCVRMVVLDLLGCILMTVHVVGLNAICPLVSHFSSPVRSFWSSLLSSGLLILWKRMVSSANSLVSQLLVVSGMSLI